MDNSTKSLPKIQGILKIFLEANFPAFLEQYPVKGTLMFQNLCNSLQTIFADELKNALLNVTPADLNGFRIGYLVGIPKAFLFFPDVDKETALALYRKHSPYPTIGMDSIECHLIPFSKYILIPEVYYTDVTRDKPELSQSQTLPS